MILNSKNSNFKVELRKGFIPEHVEKKYLSIIRRLPTPYLTALDFITHQIQTISFPSIQHETVEQHLNKNPQTWKGIRDLRQSIDREFSIEFNNTQGYLTYWILFETFEHYISRSNEEEYLPDVKTAFLDAYGHQFVSIYYRQVVMDNLSNLEASYSSNLPAMQGITVNFKCSRFEIKNETD